MRRLGELERVGRGRGLVRVGPGEVPPLGATVVDESLETVGTVIDVIGPTSAPWAVVDPANGVDLVARLGDRLYRREG